ncbi:transporter [Porphyromonas cangingivalis]|uniref:Transporter n=2 Tax=Porphyromonas cangingivalis TaxID=36874 RepID=A0A099WSP5_PORCN|nr:putative transporter [Porphyromonas cangingivalis]KGL47493.1 transporter [Porphyromonas cangingivalis]KGN83022.1 transporter [Porphyromonas cangingivalis]
MEWINNLFMGQGVAHSILLIAMTIALGMALGKIKIFGISLGVTFILFVGILFGELGLRVNHEVLHFFKEFGLILFVFSIGLQVGPSFFSNFKKGGGTMNLIAAGIVFTGAIVTIIIHFITKLPITTMVGIMSGAITNTPGLGAAQQAYLDATGIEDPTIPMGYAVAYPLGVVGIIMSIIALRVIFKISFKNEEEALRRARGGSDEALEPLSLEVQNVAIFGKTVSSLSESLSNRHFVVSRVYKRSTQSIDIAGPDTILEEGDKIFVITRKEDVEPITMMVGKEIKMDRKQWVPSNSHFVSRRVVITKSEISGKSIGALNLRALYGVNITRVNRSGFEMVASSDFRLQYGDKLTIVGSDAALSSVEKILGNSVKHLHEPNLISIFLGIALGVILGSIPMMIPGIPQPVKIGLAGGPLLVAILLASFGHKYKIVTYTTTSANLLMREIGITAFLACVGLGAGEGFLDTVVNKGGHMWVLYGVLITIIPILLMGTVARLAFKINYFTLAGLIAGSNTDPPALAYANTLSDTDASAIGYATVYPLTMFLRVLVAQLMILLFI